MNQYYRAMSPYSDELYHHGIKGQKWGVRRFQNSDGSLTPAGRARYYGSNFGKYMQSAAQKTGKVAKSIGGKIKNKVVTSIKKRHPSLMTDDELIAFKKRLDLERSYKDAVEDMRSRKFSAKTMAAIGDIMKRTGTKFGETLAQKTGEKIAAKMFESKSDKLKEKNKILEEKLKRVNNARALADASDREANLRDAESATRSRQMGDRSNNGGIRNASNSNADRLERRIDRRIERMQSRSRANERNIQAGGPQPTPHQEPQEQKPKKNKPAKLKPGTYRTK